MVRIIGISSASPGRGSRQGRRGLGHVPWKGFSRSTVETLASYSNISSLGRKEGVRERNEGSGKGGRREGEQERREGVNLMVG